MNSTDRLATLAAELERLDPPCVRSARRMANAARADLAALRRRGVPPEVLEAHAYRAQRAADVLDLALRRGMLPA